MANETHVAILKKGGDAWEQWSYERWKYFWESDAEVNFGIADFSGADFSGLDLCDLDIGSTDFSNANLSDANLSGANFEETNFSGADLERVNLSKAELMRTTLVDANLKDADLESTGLVLVNLRGANLNGANLSRACLQKANLNGADLTGANLNGTEYDDDTVWPKDFVPPKEAVKIDYWSRPVEIPQITEDFEDTLILSYSRGKLLLLTISGLVLTMSALGAIIQGFNDTDTTLLLIGFVGTPFFGMATIDVTKKLFTKPENVIINKEGIHVLDWHCGVIYWSDITGLWREDGSRGIQFIMFQLSNPSNYIQKLSPVAKLAMSIAKLVGRGDSFSLQIGLYNKNRDEVWSHLLNLIARYKIPVTLNR